MMSSWAIVAVIGIVVWGIVEAYKARHGITTDYMGNETLNRRDENETLDFPPEALREIEQLRERISVLERIATDNNSLDARERARIASEIEALREPEVKKADQERTDQ